MIQNAQIGEYKLIVFTWDWKEQPCVQSIVDAAVYMTHLNASCFAYQPETNADCFCCILSPIELSDEQAEEAYQGKYDVEERE